MLLVEGSKITKINMCRGQYGGSPLYTSKAYGAAISEMDYILCVSKNVLVVIQLCFNGNL